MFKLKRLNSHCRLSCIALINGLKYKDLSHNNGIIAIKIKQVRIRIGFERVIHKINIQSIENNIDFIEKTMTNLKVIDHLRSTLEFKIQYARGKLMSLYSHRTKRALVNVLGSAIKLIAGNPDSEDLEIINHNLATLERQENLLSKTISKQIIINEHIQNKINNITDILKKINKHIT